MSLLNDDVHHIGDTPELFIIADPDSEGLITGYTGCTWKVEKPDGSTTFEVAGTVTDEATGKSKIRATTTEWDVAGIYRIHVYFTFAGGYGFHTKLWEHEVHELYS